MLKNIQDTQKWTWIVGVALAVVVIAANLTKAMGVW